MDKYQVCRGGSDEPGVVLIIDCETGLVVAQSAESMLSAVAELVDAANGQRAPRKREQE